MFDKFCHITADLAFVYYNREAVVNYLIYQYMKWSIDNSVLAAVNIVIAFCAIAWAMAKSVMFFHLIMRLAKWYFKW